MVVQYKLGKRFNSGLRIRDYDADANFDAYERRRDHETMSQMRPEVIQPGGKRAAILRNEDDITLEELFNDEDMLMQFD